MSKGQSWGLTGKGTDHDVTVGPWCASLLFWAVSSLEAMVRVTFFPYMASGGILGTHCINHKAVEGPVHVVDGDPRVARSLCSVWNAMPPLIEHGGGGRGMLSLKLPSLQTD